MRSLHAAVPEDVLVLAASILQGIGEDRRRREVAGFVHLLSEGEDGGGTPFGEEGDGVEGLPKTHRRSSQRYVSAAGIIRPPRGVCVAVIENAAEYA